MKKLTMIVAAMIGSAALMTGVAGANSHETPSAKKLAQQQCKAEKKADKAAFKAVYGKHAMRTCKKGAKEEAQEERRNASKDCKTERAEDEETFAATYGNGKNAHGKCVSSKVKAENKADRSEFKNAAKECRAERAEDADAFRDTYGSEKSQGKNAFGKCVSSKAQKADDDETPEEPTETL